MELQAAWLMTLQAAWQYDQNLEYHLERYLREVMIPRIAPASREMILCYIAEKVLGQPKSY